MTEDKTAITGYFDITEEELITAYADKHRVTESRVVEAMTKKGIRHDKEASKGIANSSLLEERLKRLERALDDWVDIHFRCAEKTEKLEEQIARLEQELEELNKTIKMEEPQKLTDEMMAAVTGQSEWKVKLWRHGIQKPRGKIIKQKLEAYKIVDGVWMKR
ncbi:hypothetical protein [Pleurocapsa sp. FMAR1]|uniref:hypothetical protein n=1 Tax=Pleurocapsa sp. FMAR1 TaxID=3040204 RepID=UPI0029C7BD47|nr:hypothetical protein [Pleurocapsa sp. FMAR1]